MFSKRKLYYSLPPSFRFFVRRVYYFPHDVWSTLTGKRDKMIPPKGHIFIGSGDFKKIGEHYLTMFISQCNLQPHHRVLDIGCGIGRIAIPLTKYLNQQGSYEGFDIVKKGIDWCKKNISGANPNFKFLHIDLKNDLYNTAASESAKSFQFPYRDNDFDLVVLTSVFTHMMPEDVENYLQEINRVLKPGGKCFATFFILNTESIAYMKDHPAFYFTHDFGTYRLMDKQVKEANIAYDESYILDRIKESELVLEKMMYGYWSGRPENASFDFQDTMILSKK
jgi:ubiquinone/menaquinone biosynthesis C-methylase UbiE